MWWARGVVHWMGAMRTECDVKSTGYPGGTGLAAPQGGNGQIKAETKECGIFSFETPQ